MQTYTNSLSEPPAQDNLVSFNIINIQKELEPIKRNYAGWNPAVKRITQALMLILAKQPTSHHLSSSVNDTGTLLETNKNPSNQVSQKNVQVFSRFG